MTTTRSVAKEWLRSARKAFGAGDYAEALQLYEQFFEHALDDDPAALYGVRLSYCLNEWAKLGREYPLAWERLEQARDKALLLLEKTCEPERFHDFVSICRYLKCEDQPIRRFLAYHERDRELAKTIAGFIWDELVVAKEWKLCDAYLGDPIRRYESALEKFDHTMALCKADPSLGGEEFERQIKGWYVRDISNLVLVLRNAGHTDDASSILERVALDTRDRSCNDLLARIQQQVDL